jgi:hypothetical protein
MITFKCDHCNKEKQFERNKVNDIKNEAKDLREHTVCGECFTEYQSIDRQVKQFAEVKRRELEQSFFNVPEVATKIEEAINEVLAEVE